VKQNEKVMKHKKQTLEDLKGYQIVITAKGSSNHLLYPTVEEGFEQYYKVVNEYASHCAICEVKRVIGLYHNGMCIKQISFDAYSIN